MTSVDDRIVNLEFNNAAFESKIASTMSALDDLRASLKLDNVKSGLNELSTGVDNSKIDRLSQGVDAVGQHFSNMKVVAIGALLAIGLQVTNLAASMVQKMGASVTSAARDGFSDYNKKLNSVQTVMNATGKSIGEVSGQFDKLDDYADKTVFNLDDMTGAFAKFTNAGIDMNKAIPAIKGIANMTALAGQGSNEAAIAMYNLSQSLAGGFLTTTDYKSLNLANIATKEWKNKMIETAVAAGKLKKVGNDAYHIVGQKAKTSSSSAALFNDELAKGWASADVLTKVLGEYGDETTVLGKKALAAAQDVKSLPMMMETLAASAGTGWTDTFQLILGDVNESKVLFTGLTNAISGVIGRSTEARNAQIKIWRDLGGRDAIIVGIKNTWRALGNVLGPIGKAFNEVFPPSLGKKLAQLSKAFERFSKDLYVTKAAQEKIYRVSKLFFEALSTGVDIVGVALKIFGSVLQGAIKIVGALLVLLQPVGEYLLRMANNARSAGLTLESFLKVIDNLRGILSGGFGKALSELTNSLQRLRKGDKSQAKLQVQKAFETLIETGKRVKAALTPVLGWVAKTFGFTIEEVRAGFSRISGVLDTVKGKLGQMAPKITAMFGAVRDALKGLVQNVTFEQFVATLNVGMLIGMFMSVKSVIDRFLGIAEAGSGTLSKIGEAFGQLTATLKTAQTDLKSNILLKIAAAIGILAAALFVLAMIDPARLSDAGTAMAVMFAALLTSMAVFMKVAGDKGAIKMPIVAATLVVLAASVSILTSALVKMAALSWDEVVRGLTSLGVVIAFVVGASVLLSNFATKMLPAAVGMTAMAVAIGLMAGAVAIFGAMPIDVLEQGLKAVGMVMAGMTAAALALGKAGPSMAIASLGLVAMALALNMLMGPVIAFGNMPWDVVTQGLVTMGILLAGLTAAAIILSPLAPGLALAAVGMIAMAVAINMLVAPLLALGSMNWEVLKQGLLALGITLGILAIASLAMSGSIVGALALIAISAAIFILVGALAALSAIGAEGLKVALIGLAVAFGVLAAAGFVLGLVAPGLLVASLAILALSAAMMIAAIATILFAVGIASLAPALVLLTGALLVFAKAAPAIQESLGTMALLGAVLLAIGVGAAVAAVGVGLLGIAIVILAEGFVIMAAAGMAGALATVAAVQVLEKLFTHIPKILAVGAALAVLGEAIVVLAAGLLVLAVAVAGIAVALALLFVSLTLAELGLALVLVSFALVLAMAPQMTSFAAALSIVAESFSKFASAGIEAAGGLMQLINGLGIIQILVIGMSASVMASAAMFTVSFAAMSAAMITSAAIMSASTQAITKSVESLVKAVRASAGPAQVAATRMMDLMVKAFNTGNQQLQTAVKAVLKTLDDLSRGTTASTPKLVSAVSSLMTSYSAAVKNGVYRVASEVGSASESTGRNIAAGMARGLDGGSYLVTAAARRVASAALAAANAELKIKSPSRAFEKTGMWADKGLANGFLKNMGSVTKASSTVAKAALDNIKETLAKSGEGVDGDLVPTIRPVLDLDGVRDGMKGFDGLFADRGINVYGNAKMAAESAPRYSGDQTLDKVAAANSASSSVTFNQYNSSPKALSRSDIYRQTNNQLATMRGKL